MRSLSSQACAKKLGRENNSLILVLPYSIQDEKYLAQFYDEIQYPVSIGTHFKAAVGERNKWMIEKCNELVAYVEHSHGGAYTAYQFALKQEKQILNLAEKKQSITKGFTPFGSKTFFVLLIF